MRKRDRKANRSSSPLPWILLPLFAAGLVLLSTGSLTPGISIAVVLLFLLIPFVVSFHFRPPAPSPLLPAEPTSGKTLLRVGLPILLLAAAFRFFLFDRLYVWPNTDESMNGILAWDLAREWRWKFFWTFGELPPLFTWMLALGIRWFGLSHALLWAVPAAVSLLTVPAAWLAARTLGGGSFGLLTAALCAFSFWPMYAGRFCHQGVLLPFWTFLVLWALARHFANPRPRSALVLGLVTGAGSLLFTAWPPLAVLVLVVALGRALKNRGGIREAAFLFGSFAVAIAPFTIAVFTEGYGSHLGSVSAFNGYFPPGRILLTMLSYPTAILWGSLVGGDAYTAPVGGLFSPLPGAFLLLGLAEALRRRREPPFAFALAGLAVTMLPGLLSMNVEMYRVACVLPFLLLLTAVGIRGFLGTFQPRLRASLAVLVAVAILAWDTTLLTRPFLKPWFSEAGVFTALKPTKPVAMCLAHRILAERAEREGPGLVFTSFTPPFNDASLFTGTWDFNALSNPRLDPEKAHWAGFVVNVHYSAALGRRFPTIERTWLDEGLSLDDGGLAVFTVPLGKGGLAPADAARWRRVHRAFFETDIAMHHLPDTGPYRKTLSILETAIDDVKSDPFLASLYWEKTAHAGFMDRDYDANVAALRAALEEGLPTPHLKALLGALLLVRDSGDPAPSIALLEEAARDPEDRTNAKILLKGLRERAQR